MNIFDQQLFVGASLHMSSSQSGQAEYLVKLADSYTVLAPPGLGADTWRIWEALAVGYVGQFICDIINMSVVMMVVC